MEPQMEPQVEWTHYFSDKYLTLGRFISYHTQLELIREACPTSILLIGVGDNVVPNLLRQSGLYNVTTVDIDPALNPDIVSDIKKMPFENGSFDVVCAFEVLEHMPMEETNKALEEMARVAKDKVVISVPHRRVSLEMVFRFPFVQTLTGKKFLRIFAYLPIKFPGFEESGQHYWEIDGYQTKLRDFRKILRSNFVILKEKTPLLNAYHRFFVLKK